uniref:PHD finger protein 11 n=1 Tax=Semicossyphus pulcher TaxID=241346 RepID=UPI0037E858E2
MGRGHRVACVLCQRSEETKITGPLSTKEEVTAHQDCLLYSSGICCQNSPLDDDLFGFSVEDVLKEVKRGKLLKCCRCNKSGATAGCEVGRCKKSYHYPCAVEEKAHLVDDKEGRYALYCVKHHEMQKNNGSVNGRSPSSTKRNTSESPSEAGPSKRNTNGDSSGAGPSGYSTDSPSRMTHVSSKRQRPSSHDSEEESPSKRKSKRRTSGLSSNSDDDPPNSEMAPIEFDFDESANSLSQSLLDR